MEMNWEMLESKRNSAQFKERRMEPEGLRSW